MAVDLIYKHQQKIHKLLKEELKRSKRAAYETPTGSGKSFPGLKYIDENPDKTALIIVPSTTIKSQWEKYIAEYVENGKERLKNKNITIVTYQKIALLSKKTKNLKADIIIIDELHRMGAETWEPAIDELIESQLEAEVIAMTATPRRTDKRNMAKEKFGDNIIYEMSLTEALSGEKEGEVVLKTPRYIRVLSELKPKLSEYKERISYIEDNERRERLLKRYEKLETIISNSPDIQDVMLAGMQKKNGKYIVFCKDRADMMAKMAEAQEIFGKVNEKIHAEYVLTKNEKGDKFGKTEVQNRKTLEKFEDAEPTDELQLLFCVDKLNEGVHIEGIDGIVLFDLTKSPVLYKQRIGRATTTDRETVIIDAVNNWLEQIDVYMEIDRAIQKGQNRGDNTKANYDLFKLLPEETELLEILREIGEGLRYNDNKTYEEIIKWLETHEGEMPRSNILINNKQLTRNEMTKEEQYEVKLYARWRYSDERKKLEEYVGIPIEEVAEEYREKIARLRQFGYGLPKKTTYEQIIEWFETHNGNLPRANISIEKRRLKREDMTEEEQYEVNLHHRWYHCEEKRILKVYEGRAIEEVPEEYREKIARLREYLLEKTTYEQIIEWFETHNGNLPRGDIKVNGNFLRANDMTEKEQYEVNLRRRWNKSQEIRILEEYAGRPIEEVPEECREKIARLREYGYGLKEKTTYEQIIKWLETHNGDMPRGEIRRDGKILIREEMTKKEKDEINLSQRWKYSKEKKKLEEYAGRPIEEVPEEYRDKIGKLREYGLGKKEKTAYEQIIEWLETHEGEMPRSNILINNKQLTRNEMTKEEQYETNLYSKWNRSEERKKLEEYAGRPIEEVPEEYREKIARLRKYGYGLKEKTTYEQIVEWLESHKGNIPNASIRRNGKKLKVQEMTEKEQYEVSLYNRWRYSEERKILDEYVGRSIEEVPEEYREKIARLRKLGYGLPKKTTYEQIIEWLESHNGDMPRANIDNLKRKDMTEDEKYEANLRNRWKQSQEIKILEEYAGRPIEEVPGEYREKIAKLRSLGQLGTKKDDQIRKRMKKAVGKKVGENGNTREELDPTKQFAEHTTDE